MQTKEKEFFFGGGHQNGRFSHKNETIQIKNESNWVDGGVASPSPFYVSSSGYGVLRHTWQDGVYHFYEKATFSHEEERFDAFYFVSDKIVGVLSEYTELTGRPVFLPKYAYYLGHADCFNRDSVNKEDGTSRLETLMIDAAGMIDQYVAQDMPLGWFLPNDGYGCGYGQTDSFEGDLKNLADFVTYAKKNGVKTGLWTQSEIFPKDVNAPKKGECDIAKEVGMAGTVAVKTDVAWVGDGYSKEFKEKNAYSRTKITASCDSNSHFQLNIEPTTGQFRGMCKERGTQLMLHVLEKPSNIQLQIGGRHVTLSEASDFTSCFNTKNTYFYEESYQWPHYATKGSAFEEEPMIGGSRLWIKIEAYDITIQGLSLSMDLTAYPIIKIEEEVLAVPSAIQMDDTLTTDACAAILWESVKDAEFYEVLKNGILHTNIQAPCFADPHVEAASIYTYQVRSKTKGKASAWSETVPVTTKEDHYKDVPVHITASYTGESHPYYLPESAVDHNEATFFSSYKGAKGQDFILDMEMIYDIESLHYTPKELKEKGTILNMDILGSLDGLVYRPIKNNVTFTFEKKEIGYLTEKVVSFDHTEKLRFIKLHIKESVEDFVAAHALYPYKVPKSNGYPAGDYNQDGMVDEGDLMFLQNYAGIHETDNVWPHVSIADVNFNGVIDAYDIAFLTAQLDGGIQTKEVGVEGQLNFVVPKQNFQAGESFILSLEGKGLRNVNAFSVELLLDTEAFCLEHCESGACQLNSALAEPSTEVASMMNFTARREEKGVIRLFLAFANKGEKKTFRK